MATVWYEYLFNTNRMLFYYRPYAYRCLLNQVIDCTIKSEKNLSFSSKTEMNLTIPQKMYSNVGLFFLERVSPTNPVGTTIASFWIVSHDLLPFWYSGFNLVFQDKYTIVVMNSPYQFENPFRGKATMDTFSNLYLQFHYNQCICEPIISSDHWLKIMHSRWNYLSISMNVI